MWFQFNWKPLISPIILIYVILNTSTEINVYLKITFLEISHLYLYEYTINTLASQMVKNVTINRLALFLKYMIPFIIPIFTLKWSTFNHSTRKSPSLHLCDESTSDLIMKWHFYSLVTVIWIIHYKVIVTVILSLAPKTQQNYVSWLFAKKERSGDFTVEFINVDRP